MFIEYLTTYKSLVLLHLQKSHLKPSTFFLEEISAKQGASLSLQNIT